MPRPGRIHLEGALYYVVCRGEPEAPLFKDRRDVETYLDLLSFYKARHRFKLFAYALSADRVQLCLEVAAGSTISETMHALNSRYTKLYGRRYRRSGHLFQGRFKATVLEKESSLVPLSRYLHAQPELLASSLAQYVRPDSSWLDREEVLRHFPDRQAYEAYVRAAIPEELEQWRRMLEQPAVGSKLFLERVEQVRKGKGGSGHGWAQGSSEEETPALQIEPARELPVAVPVRRRWGGLQRFLSLAALAGLLYSVGNVTLLLKGRWGPTPEGLVPEGRTLEARPQRDRVSEPEATLATGAPTIPARLGGTQWTIQVAPMYAREGGLASTDRLRFEGNRMSSDSFSALGFPASNVTLTLQEDGRLVWETMQTHPDGETVFWRGELKDGQMRGIFSRHPKGAAPQDFIFRGVARELAEEKTL